MHDEELRARYPALKDEDLTITKENLDRYLEIAWGIMEEKQIPTASLDGRGIPGQDARKVDKSKNN